MVMFFCIIAVGGVFGAAESVESKTTYCKCSYQVDAGGNCAPNNSIDAWYTQSFALGASQPIPGGSKVSGVQVSPTLENCDAVLDSAAASNDDLCSVPGPTCGLVSCDSENSGCVPYGPDALYWTSDFTPISLSTGETNTKTISASGGSTIKLSCDNCDPLTFVDNGDGTATLTWNFVSPPAGAAAGVYTVNLSAEKNNDASKKITGSLQYTFSGGSSSWVGGEGAPPDLVGNGSGVKTGINCGIDPPGKNYAVFAVANTSQAGPPPSFDPSTAKKFCVLVSESQTVVTFQDLASAGVFDLDKKSVDANIQERSCDGGWSERYIFFDKRADEIQYKLSRTIERGCLAGQKHMRLRYRIEIDGDKFLYFLGYFIHDSGNPNAEAKQKADGAVCGTYNSQSDCRTKSPDTCFWHTEKNKCFWKFDNSVCYSLPKPICGTELGSTICSWNDALGRCITSIDKGLLDEYKKPDGYDGPLPDCAFAGQCRDVNDLLQIGINIGRFVFGFIGMLALAMFVYGGFFLVFSLGNPEKVKKGSGILMGAVVGMIIAFGAYILIDFILDALGVADTFRGIG